MIFAFLRKNEEGNNGQYNGYVGITKDETPIYARDFIGGLVSVHGGITFDTIFTENRKDYIAFPLTDIPEDVTGARILGFDTFHYDDTAELDYEWCKKETLEFLEQVKKIVSEMPSEGFTFSGARRVTMTGRCEGSDDRGCVVDFPSFGCLYFPFGAFEEGPVQITLTQQI